jgi:glycosyltransferase involved in cell wall biosynthesis
MHIAYNGWFWDQPGVGSGQYIRRLLHALRRLSPDLQMTLILPPHNHTPDDLPLNVSLVTTTGPRGKFGKIWFEQRTYPQMVAQVGADIAHVPYWGSPLRSPAKLVTSVLDVIPLALPDYARSFWTRLYTSLVTATTRGSAHIITISDAAKADIVKYLNIPPENITPTHLAVDDVYHPRIGKERDEDVRRKYDLPDQFVLYIGGYDLRKNVNQLLLAYTYVVESHGDTVPLVLAGREPAWGTSVFPDLRTYVKQLDLEDTVRWIGYFDEADKPSLYRLADVFVYPSVYEGFGLPVLEAMACGTPTVALDIEVMREIVGDGAYLVDNARTMAGAIIALLIQEPLRDSLINQGLAQATNFSWRKTAKDTLIVYEKVIGSQ